MPRSSLASEYFERLKAKGAGLFTHLASLPSAKPRVAEEEWLDFKGVARLPEKAIAEIWSQSLAAFATTQGGVLIWGVDCRKDSVTKIDCVTALSLVKDPEAFRSRLMELHHQSTEPPVVGVECLAVPDPGNPAQGFVVCLIPESTAKPVRAEHCGKQYYIRAGDDSIVPSPALLRLLFVPGSNATLSVSSRVSHVPHVGPGSQGTAAAIALSIGNSGLVSAKSVTLRLSSDLPGHAAAFPPFRDQRFDGNRFRFVCSEAIHPGDTVPVCQFTDSRYLLAQPDDPCGVGVNKEIVFDLRLFGENMVPKRGVLLFTWDELFRMEMREVPLGDLP